MVLALFLGINAFFVLLPMLPQLTELARLGMEQGRISSEFEPLAFKEELVGAANTLPLLTLVVFGVFEPSLTKRAARPAR